MCIRDRTNLNGESNLTFDGTTLQVENSGSGLRNLLRLKNSNASAGVSGLYFNSTTSGTAFDAACVRNGVNGSGQGRLYLQTNNGSGLVTNLNIEYDGQVSIPTNSLNIIDSIIHIGDTDTKIRFPADNQIAFETAGSERLRISSDGTTTFDPSAGGTLKIGGSSAHTSKIVVADNGGTGNGNCLVEGGDGSDFFTIQSNGNVNFASGNGITFADSSTSQVLDDYEEGSWTPTFVSTGASWAYNHQYGYYQKVGNTVHVSFYITLGNGTVVTGTTSNSLHIAVPFTATGATRYEAACCFSMIYKFNTNANVAGDIPLTGRLYSGESKIDLLAQFDDAGGYAYTAVKANQAGCGLAGSITYRV